MEIEIFTLADYAQDVSGKLFINGTFDTINSQQFPLVYPGFALAMRLRFSEREAGAHQLTIKALDPNGKELIQTLDGSVQVPPPQAPATYTAVNFAANLQQVRLEAAGVYTFELYVDGDWCTGLKMSVLARG